MAEQPDPALTKVEPLNGAADPKINFAGLDNAVKRVNALLAAATSTGSLNSSTRTRHEALRQDVDNARDALAKAASQVALATSTLSQAALEESIRLPTTLEGDNWYENIDFFALAEEDIRTMLSARPPKDADAFSDYVSRVTKARIKDYYPHKHVVRDTKFARKALQLICVLLATDNGAFAGFRHLVRSKTETLDSEYNTSMTVEDFKSLCGAVDKAIRWLLERKPKDPPATVKFHDGLTFRCKSVPEYFNAAHARRVLYEGWVEYECEDDDGFTDDGDGESSFLCWHMRNEALLVLLNKRAYQEIKSTVWLATEHMLPLELVEEVFEYALLEEGVPSDATLYTQYNQYGSRTMEEYRAPNCPVWC
ncbi:hypothetical protein LTR56_018003 [Elasticomyces elasticus]|nr:hypothetical protein LTR56_018003 [Elasticomyces elasticus]KAK3663338.1 hypothetical protein LTR22_005745 [Elasticomyces elasticus]KAK4925417.1 hypothetical protein LTR49_007481 [Elasticomyces elasticus]KAK5764512.1 hypothetical protein LTS12_005242 [Elasticomyces elasticus]